MTRSVIVVGAGIGGLTTAHALLQIGCSVTIIESAHTLRAVGAGIYIQPNGLSALRHLGLYDDIAEGGLLYSGTCFRRQNGEMLRYVARSATLSIHRAVLQAKLVRGVAGLIRAGTKVIDVRNVANHVEVLLEDGGHLSADLVVGADGVRSTVRRRIDPFATLSDSGYTVLRGVSMLKLSPEEQGHCTEWYADDADLRVGTVPCKDGTFWWVPVLMAASGDLDRQRDDILQRIKVFSGPISEIIESTPSASINATRVHELLATKWSEGRIVLLGDAAHAFHPVIGQGGCMAIEDAVLLQHSLLREPDVPKAIRTYEQLRFPRVSRVFEIAKRRKDSFGRKNYVINDDTARAHAERADTEWLATFSLARESAELLS